MKKFKQLLEKYDLEMKKSYKGEFLVLKKGEVGTIYKVDFEKYWYFKFESPIYFLRVMSKRLNFFKKEEEEKEFFRAFFAVLKKYADTSLAYSYLFVDDIFIPGKTMRKKHEIDSRFYDSLTYGHHNKYQFQSEGNTEEADQFFVFLEEMTHLFEHEKKLNPLFYFKRSHYDYFEVYEPDTTMKIKLEYEKGNIILTVQRDSFSPKITEFTVTNDRNQIRRQLENWLKKLRGQNRIKALFKEKKEVFFHQKKLADSIRRVSFWSVFHELKKTYSDEELERMAATEYDEKNKEQFVFTSTILGETMYLALFKDHYFIFNKEKDRKLLHHFQAGTKKEAMSCFQEYQLKLFKERMKEEKKNLQKFFA